MSPKDHGRIALLGLLLAGLKSQFPQLMSGTGIPLLDALLFILINVLIVWGAIAGILWLKEKIKSRDKKS
ncbi:hypothetical protein COY43_02275 [Candidatus Berkelbacteria bacterium CG_4_10_14_0_8_um_filter_35_9_33_8]|nr:MAG: hypothetical protein COY43_02275 [Candidatus Berkelbacteria bacterium CG_4_10_14_0_8_um_filter_35_9_33_8]